jgi:hypothetical protein
VLIQNWESFLGKLSIPVTEDRLLEIYHSVLTERGVADYPNLSPRVGVCGDAGSQDTRCRDSPRGDALYRRRLHGTRAGTAAGGNPLGHPVAY